jgi:transposase
VARFLTISDGEIIANPRFLDAAQERIANLQCRKERARPGSGNRRRLRRALAKEWRKVRNVAAKARLNRSILDAGWTQFTSILAAKAESAGRQVVLVHAASTSIDCHTCGARCSRPRQDTVVCPVHGDLDADLNGARNIAARAGLGSGQASAA